MKKDFFYNPELNPKDSKREMEYISKREEWLAEGQNLNARYLFIMYDRAEKEYYPVYVNDGENFEGKRIEYSQANMQKLKEIVDLSTGRNVE